MKLLDKSVKISQIMLDPQNPRFLKYGKRSQSEIMEDLLGAKETKELANSMNKSIKWINKIVIRDINTVSEQNKNFMPDINKYEYIVVEGNSRLACLKSGKVQPNVYNMNTKIPVLIAAKEKNETEENYEIELEIIQGISNVMVVKEWNPMPKARHLYNMYTSKKKVDTNEKMIKISSDIAQELGMKVGKVKEDIIRYSIFKEVNELSDTISEEDWGFLEAFDNTSKLRVMFGMCKGDIEFEWNKSDKEYPFATEKQELLIEIPDIIKSAKKEYSNSKKFRDVFKKIIKKYDDFDEFKNVINNIIDNEDSATWSIVSEEIEGCTQEEKSKNDLKIIYNKLEDFPVGADWAKNLKEDLINIEKKIERYIKIIES